MVTRRTQNEVKETFRQTSQTIVFIEWLSCLRIDAANHHEVCKTYCKYLGRGRNLEFALQFIIRVSLELSCQPEGDLARQSQRPQMKTQSALNIYSCIPT